MHGFHWIAGGLLAAVWLRSSLQAAFGMPKVPHIDRPEYEAAGELASATGPAWPQVSIVVPARNEEHSLRECLESLLALDYPNYEIIAVNDRSTDHTGEIMDELALAHPCQLRVIHVASLPEHWLGKTHAMWRAARQASGDWLLFTDADVVFRPDSLRRALAFAERARVDHLVLLPTMVMESVGERMMIAFFQVMFIFAHRPWKVADPKAKDHMGVGAFNLIRRAVYEELGTYERLRLSVLDDMKLGEIVKRGGYAQRNVFGKDLIRIRWARGALGIVNNLTKNFFAVLRFNWLLALAACAALVFVNAMPFAGILIAPGWSRLGYAIALFCIVAIYGGMSRYSPISPLYVLLHPLSTVMFGYAILRSTVATLRRGGVEWRGTVYALEELRRESI